MAGMFVPTTLLLPLSSLLMEIGNPRRQSRSATLGKICTNLLAGDGLGVAVFSSYVR